MINKQVKQGISWEQHTLGLYSALRACNAIALRSNLQSKLTVDTIFLHVQNHQYILLLEIDKVTFENQKIPLTPFLDFEFL